MSEYTYTYEEPEGTLYVTILYADELSHHDMNRGNVTYHRPELEISTNPDRDTQGYLTLRGRKYSMIYNMTPLGREGVSKPFASAKTGELCTWQVTHVPYNGGYRNENGIRIDYDSPVDAKLDVIRNRVLHKFATDHPEWETVSVRLGLEGDVSKAEGEASNLRRQLQVAEAAIAAAKSRLNGFSKK